MTRDDLHQRLDALEPRLVALEEELERLQQRAVGREKELARLVAAAKRVVAASERNADA